MEPDRAHRSLNTLLLVMLFSMVSVTGQADLNAIAVRGAGLLMILLLIKILLTNLDEVMAYLGMAEAQ